MGKLSAKSLSMSDAVGKSVAVVTPDVGTTGDKISGCEAPTSSKSDGSLGPKHVEVAQEVRYTSWHKTTKSRFKRFYKNNLQFYHISNTMLQTRLSSSESYFSAHSFITSSRHS